MRCTRWIEQLQRRARFRHEHADDRARLHARRDRRVWRSAVEPNAAAYVPLAHDYAGAPAQLARDAVLEALKPLLESEQPRRSAHDLKYDAHVLNAPASQLRGMRFDSMLESYVWNSTATRHDIDALARKYLGVDTMRYEDLTGRARNRSASVRSPSISRPNTPPSRPTSRCSCIEPVAEVDSAPTLRTLYDAIEQPLAPVLQRMEQTRRADRRRSAAGAKQSNWRRACASSKRRPTRRRAGRFRSNRRNSCRKCCSANSGCRSSARRRPVSPRRRKTCSRSLRRNTSCRA